MGIKFRCPNGHKLNVKAFLAGKRGICPKCGERFDIPARSGGQVVSKGRKRPKEESPGESERQTREMGQAYVGRDQELGGIGVGPGDSPVVLEVQDVAGAGAPEALAPPGLFADDPDSIWYVRPASGGQFGPAASNVMRQWIDEGRIAADSMVWQNGWETWRKADDVFPQVGSGTTSIDRPTDRPDAIRTAVDEGARPLVRQKNKSMMRLSLILIGVIVVLGVVLVAVVISMR